MLDKDKVPYTYRDYDKEPLSADEIHAVLAKLGLAAKAVVRKRDKAFKTLGLAGDEPDDVLVPHMAANPGLIERPIGVAGDKAVIGRPPEKLLELV